MNAILKSTLLLATLAAATQPAQALEHLYGSYSGGTCKAMYGSDTGLFRTDSLGLWYSGAGSVNKTVVCPLVRQHVTNSGGTYGLWIKARSAGGRTLTCTSQALDINGNLVASKSASTTSSTVTTLSLDLDASGPYGTYALFCSVPPNGSLWTYQINELK